MKDADLEFKSIQRLAFMDKLKPLLFHYEMNHFTPIFRSDPLTNKRLTTERRWHPKVPWKPVCQSSLIKSSHHAGRLRILFL